jgi:uncharacterized membrane protein YkoI
MNNVTNTNDSMNMTGQNMTTGEDKHNYYMDKEHERINGTIDIMDTMFEAIASKLNITLTDAITTAQQSVGNNSYAMEAKGGMKDGFMVYSVVLGTPDMEFYKVIVDPGNGQILSSNELSMMEWMMMMHEGQKYEKGGMMADMHGDYSEYSESDYSDYGEGYN